MPEEKYIRCKRCGCSYPKGHTHTCDKRDVASLGKHICIDCMLHDRPTLKELRAIPKEGYCKHLTPEYWEKKGYERHWGDAAVSDFPNLEILLREDDAEVHYLILNGTLRRPVEIHIDKKTGQTGALY